MSTPEALSSTLSAVSLDEKARTVYVIGGVDEEMVRGVAAALAVLRKDGASPVRLVVCSPGGDEPCGWALHDLLLLCGMPTVFEGYGQVYSIMSFVMQGATTRRLAPNCQVMIHNGTIDVAEDAKYNDAEQAVDEARRNCVRYYQGLARRSRLTVDQIANACRREASFSAEEAVRIGLADEVMVVPEKPKKRGPRAGEYTK